MYFVGRDEREILAPGPFQADKCFEGEVPAAAYSCRLLALRDFFQCYCFMEDYSGIVIILCQYLSC